MRHDIWQAAKSGFTSSFRFGGSTCRAEFWLWIGTLFVISALTSQVQIILLQTFVSKWPSYLTLDFGQSISLLRSAWPADLALTNFPFGYFSGIALIATPVLILVNLLAIAPIVRRSRDAGYSPLWTIVLLYWSVIGSALILVITIPVGMSSEGNAWMVFFATTAFFHYVSQPLATLMALLALYRLTAPSKSNTEATS